MIKILNVLDDKFLNKQERVLKIFINLTIPDQFQGRFVANTKTISAHEYYGYSGHYLNSIGYAYSGETFLTNVVKDNVYIFSGSKPLNLLGNQDFYIYNFDHMLCELIKNYNINCIYKILYFLKINDICDKIMLYNIRLRIIELTLL